MLDIKTDINHIANIFNLVLDAVRFAISGNWMAINLNIETAVK